MLVMRETNYDLRSSGLLRNRRKRHWNGDLDHVATYKGKRIRRSNSASSQKENNVPRTRKSNTVEYASCPHHKVDTLNPVNEGLITFSTPVQRSKVTGSRFPNIPHRWSIVGDNQDVISRRRTLRSAHRSGTEVFPNAELRVELERFPIGPQQLPPRRPVLRSDTNSASGSNVSTDSSQTELLTMDSATLMSWFSPRRFTSAGKDQAAKLKRINKRKIEFDLQELSQLIDTEAADLTSDSILNQSIVGDPLEKLLGLCGQTIVKPFGECFDSESLQGLEKIGEGVYGEVFQLLRGHVVKIFPVDGDNYVNGERQMSFAEVYPEVFVSKKLSELSYKYRRNRSVNFAQLKKATVVYGTLPEEFAASWRKFKNQRGSDNECPDFLPPKQQWMVLEFEYAGEPLANIRFNTCREARSVIEQIALSLAAAESELQFEHRDLHWHNILLRPTRQYKLRYRVAGVSYVVFTEGIQVTIIDFTVSRLCHEGNIVYVDMADSPEIFECEGDYQFDIYRIMRDNNNNDWRPFHPVTNLYWLHYLMGKLLTETSYPRRDPDSQPVESELRALHDMVLSSNYKSAQQLVSTSFYFDTCRVG